MLRDNGFSPLGIPRLRGFVYTIAVIDRGGEDGRLIIDARNGRIIRFMPAYRMGGNFDEKSRVIHAPPAVPTPEHVVGAPQPPRPGPKVASRTVPVPKANPLAAKALAPEAVKQAAAPVPKPAEAQAAAPPAVTTGSAPEKPAPQIAPTEEMPKSQWLE